MDINDLKFIAKMLEDDFKVQYKSVGELSNDSRDFGSCDVDKNILIRLKQYKKNKDLKDSTVIDTLCHEMAHILFFDHSKKHKAVLRLMLKRAKYLLGKPLS